MNNVRPAKIAGKYKVLKELGEGGVGTVYLVEHADLKVRYALKVLNDKLSNDKRFIEHFRREAEILLKFDHPGSIQLRDFGKTEQGRYYMAMDFSEGELLSNLIAKRGHFSVIEALELVEQLLAVLDAAHKLGIVHHDIKPDNLLVEQHKDGKQQLRILDFGIASIRDISRQGAAGVGQGMGQGVVIGTPEYMAPEQAAGENELDARVDIYAVGVLFYELLSGKLPFREDTVVKTLLMHLIQPVEALDAKLQVPLIVEELVSKALQKEKERRFQSAGEFRKAVREVLSVLSEKPLAPDKTVSGVVATPVAASEPAKSAAGLRVLCLDDDEMLLNLMRHILEREGYKVYAVSSYTAIHKYVFKEGVDLLITDVNMPGLSGGKVCEMIKSSKPQLKILLFSNIAERDLEHLAKSSHADGWISKNWKPEQWLEKIRVAVA